MMPTTRQRELTAQLFRLDPNVPLHISTPTDARVAIGATVGEIQELLTLSVRDIRELLAAPTRTTPLIEASIGRVQEWSNALADCLCWFRGFYAAQQNADDSMMPPNWRVLTEINLAMKAHIDAVSPDVPDHPTTP